MTATNRNFLGDAPYGHIHSGETLTVDSGGSLVIASGATFTLSDPDITGDVSISGTLLNKRKVTSLTTASPSAITAADSGTLYAFNRAAGVSIALPAIGASDVGIWYDFVFETTATGDHIITAQAADLLKGGLWCVDFDAVVTAPQGIFLEPDGTDDLIITMNGTTKGGKTGSWLRLVCTSATSWYVSGVLAGDGSIASVFS
jgi:hypothetical protein